MRFASRSALLLAVLLVAWLAYDRPGDSEVAAPPTDVSSTNSPGELDPSASTLASEPVAGPGDARSQVDVARSDVLRFVDDATGEPVVGLAYRVRDLSSAEPLLASGVTDARGLAEHATLPDEPLVVTWDRSPPHALGTQLVDPSRSTDDALAVRVGRGGSIRGRVVDDAGAPIEGVTWFATNGSPGFGGYPKYDADAGPAAVTDAGGHFEVTALSERPRKLRIEDGALQVGAWERVALMAPNPFLESAPIGFVNEPLEADEDLELAEPIVFDRPRTVTGRLVFPDGSPAVAHFVTANARERFGGQYDPPTTMDEPLEYRREGFAVGLEECITDATGAFSFSSTPRTTIQFFVADETGRLWSVRRDAETDEEGTMHLGVVTLEDFETCTILLVDPQGRPLQPAALRYGGPRLVARADLLYARGIEKFNVSFVDARSRVESDYFGVRPDGRLRFVPTVDPSELRSISLFSGTFLPARLPLPDGFDPAREYTVTLTPLPRLRVTVDLAGDAPDLDDFRLSVHACVATREQREAEVGHTIDQEESLGRAGCCRLGCAKIEEWRGGTFTADLPVLSDDAYWIYVRGRGRSTELPVQVHGPFRPGPDVRALTIASDAFRAIEPMDAATEVRTGRARERGAESSAWALITLTDARTGEPISGGSVLHQSVSDPDAYAWPASIRPTEDGPGRAQLFRGGGPHRLTATAPGYIEVDLGVHDLVVGETIDLGAVALEARPHFRIRVVEADGAPVAASTLVYAGRFQAEFGEDGRLTILHDLPQDFMITFGDWGGAFHVIEVNGWTEDEVREVRLAPTRDVEVVVRGIAPQHELSRMVLYLVPATIALERYGDSYFPRGHASNGHRRLEGTSHRGPGTVSFAAELAVGTYRVRFTSPLYAIPETLIEVTEGEGTKVFELDVE